MLVIIGCLLSRNNNTFKLAMKFLLARRVLVRASVLIKVDQAFGGLLGIILLRFLVKSKLCLLHTSCFECGCILAIPTVFQE